MPSSLDKLAASLEQHRIVNEEFKKDGYDEDKIKLLTRKGVYPYEYTSSFKSLEVQELPSIEDFYSSLNDEGISEKDYQHAQRVWNTFEIENLGGYCDLYLKTDVLLLADVFQNFRDSCMEAYSLDVAHYFTTPGFSWDAMLKYTGVSLQLFTDVDMLLFVERGIRGGISQCSNRFAKSNNRYMDNFDQN